MLRGTDAGHLTLSFILVGEIPSKHYPNTFIFRRDYLEEVLKANGQPVGDPWFLMARVGSAAQIPAVIKAIDDHSRTRRWRPAPLPRAIPSRADCRNWEMCAGSFTA